MLPLNQHNSFGLDYPMLDTSKDALPRTNELGLETEYPFTSHVFQTPKGQMDYVGEGTAKDCATVSVFHGNPSWSFLYRPLIKGLVAERLTIAPDHIGFGLSDKSDDEAACTLKASIDHLEALVFGVNPTNVTLVMQDWDGPIGLGARASHISGRQSRRMDLACDLKGDDL